MASSRTFYRSAGTATMSYLARRINSRPADLFGLWLIPEGLRSRRLEMSLVSGCLLTVFIGAAPSRFRMLAYSDVSRTRYAEPLNQRAW